MIQFVGSDEARQSCIFSGDIPGVREAFKGTRFDVIGDYELGTVTATANTMLRGRMGDAKN